VPRRRTFATGILPVAHSDAAYASPSWLRLAAYAGSRGTGSLKPRVFGDAQLQIRRRSAVSAESVGGHAQKKGNVEDHRRPIKTHEIRTLNMTRIRACPPPAPNTGHYRPPCRPATGHGEPEAGLGSSSKDATEAVAVRSSRRGRSRGRRGPLPPCRRRCGGSPCGRSRAARPVRRLPRESGRVPAARG
jgi:hypothetical protein